MVILPSSWAPSRSLPPQRLGRPNAGPPPPGFSAPRLPPGVPRPLSAGWASGPGGSPPANARGGAAAPGRAAPGPPARPSPRRPYAYASASDYASAACKLFLRLCSAPRPQLALRRADTRLEDSDIACRPAYGQAARPLPTGESRRRRASLRRRKSCRGSGSVRRYGSGSGPSGGGASGGNTP